MTLRAFHLAQTLYHQPLRVLQLPLLGPIILLMLGSLVGLAVSYDLSLSLPFALSVWGSALLYLALVWWCATPARVRLAAQVIVTVASAGALGLLLQYRHLGFEPKLRLITQIGRFTSAPFPALLPIAVQQNVAAAFLEGALPLAVGVGWSERGFWRYGGWGCAILLGAGVLLTVSRGAILALLICTGIAALAWMARRKPQIVSGGLVGAGLVLLVSLALLISTPLHELHQVQSLLERAQDRAILYRNSLHLALDMPFTGIGIGDTFAMMYSRYVLLINYRYLTYAHNLLLSIWLAQGLLGLLGFVGVLSGTARRMWRAGKQGSGALWSGAALGSLALLLHGLSDAPQYNPDGWGAMLMAWALLAVAVASARQHSAHLAFQTSAPAWVPLWRRLRRLPRLALAMVLLASVIFAGGRQIAALAAINAGALAEARADLTPGLDDSERSQLSATATNWYGRALHLVPDHPRAARRLGIRALTDLRLAEAIHWLEIAQHGAPTYQATPKALGYAYLWSGRVQPAVALFRQLDRNQEVKTELGTWIWWWNEQGYPDRANFAAEARKRLEQQQAAR